MRELAALEGFLEAEGPSTGARVHRLPVVPAAGVGADVEGEDGVEVGASMRAVAPPVQSFAAGRRR